MSALFRRSRRELPAKTAAIPSSRRAPLCSIRLRSQSGPRCAGGIKSRVGGVVAVRDTGQRRENRRDAGDRKFGESTRAGAGDGECGAGIDRAHIGNPAFHASGDACAVISGLRGGEGFFHSGQMMNGELGRPNTSTAAPASSAGTRRFSHGEPSEPPRTMKRFARKKLVRWFLSTRYCRRRYSHRAAGRSGSSMPREPEPKARAVSSSIDANQAGKRCASQRLASPGTALAS